MRMSKEAPVEFRAGLMHTRPERALREQTTDIGKESFGQKRLSSIRSTQYAVRLRDLLRLLLQKVHQDELAERHGIREVRLPFADLGDALHELDERTVAREHEGVDEDACAAAVRDFAQGLGDHGAVEA